MYRANIATLMAVASSGAAAETVKLAGGKDVRMFTIVGAIILLLLARIFYLVWRYKLKGGPLFLPVEATYGKRDMCVVSESENELIVHGSLRFFILNRAQKTISTLESDVIKFGAVREVRIDTGNDLAEPSRRDPLTGWIIDDYVVSLSYGPAHSINLGYTYSYDDALNVAAKISAWTGKKMGGLASKE